MPETFAQIRSYAFAPMTAPIPVSSWREALALFRGQGGFVWIDIEDEFDVELETVLVEKLGWHPTVLQNIKQPSSRPKLTPFEYYSHLTMHILPPDAMRSRDLRAREIDLVLGEDYLITFHHDKMEGVDQLLDELPQAKTSPKSPDLLVHRILALAGEALAPEVEHVNDVVAALEEEAFNQPGEDLLERIVHARDELFLLQRSLTPQLQVMLDVNSGASPFVTEYAHPYFKAQENRLRGLMDDINVYKEMAQAALELYRSSITHKTNETIRVLTVISIPLMVLTFLTGLYGMNVPLPFSGFHHVFWVMLGISLLVFSGMLWWFRRRKWF